ncbi:MAG: 6-phosphogluconolactonase [Chloroflexota bacterium]|jgi:6-phosphogluconolactonase|nr:6-phosphogluconolactonase [Chloroflexota bacterium]
MTSQPAGEPTIRVLADAEAAARAAAERIAATLTAAVARRGRADFATTGGSNPVAIYRHLATSPLRESVPWDDVHIWFGDDRYLPRDHPLSNVILVDQGLLAGAAFAGQSGTGASGIDVERGRDQGVQLPPDHVHPFPVAEAIGEARGPAWCAATYAAEIRATVPSDDAGWPAFDLLLIGVGPDAHVLSVFPGSAALASPDLALAIPAPTHVEPHVERVTLNPAILGAAGDLVAVVPGSAKAEAVSEIFGPRRDPDRWPAQLARRAGAIWFLDEAAAARLPSDAVRA